MKVPRETERGRERERPPTPAPEHPLLALQRGAGNHAVGRMLARKPAAKHIGLRNDAAIDRFVHKASAFAGRNGDAPLKQFALYLGAAVNEELAALGVPAVNVTLGKGAVGGAAEFYSEGWFMILNPADFSHRADVKTIADLTPEETALIAGRFMHEARHAEQHFRVARLQAAEGKDPADAVDESVAGAAAAAPLKATGQELREAKEWQANEIGEDGQYREIVTWWQNDAHAAAKLSDKVDDEDAASVRAQLLARLHDWDRPLGAGGMVAAHLESAKRRGKTDMIADIAALTAALAGVRAAFDALPEKPQVADFKPLTSALGTLTRVATHAYVNQPVETDAYDVGGAATTAYEKQAAP